MLQVSGTKMLQKRQQLLQKRQQLLEARGRSGSCWRQEAALGASQRRKRHYFQYISELMPCRRPQDASRAPAPSALRAASPAAASPAHAASALLCQAFSSPPFAGRRARCSLRASLSLSLSLSLSYTHTLERRRRGVGVHLV
jgi:hypothetical protein